MSSNHIQGSVPDCGGNAAVSGLTLAAPAKLNVFLEILGKRPDGFHELETVMLRTQFADQLTVHPTSSAELTLQFSDATPDHLQTNIPLDGRNLILRAAAAVRDLLGVTTGARFILHKRIPPESGLGGGSSNAATALLLYGFEDVVKLRQMALQSEGNELFKRHEQQRLTSMLGLCEVTSCRRQVLLRYFGDTLDAPCGNCDNCLDPPEEWDGSEAARMALSCVYRTGQRFGANHLIDVLRGAENDRILSFDHHRVSTFGIGKDIPVEQWRSVFRQLVARGYLDVDPEGYGGLRLSAAAKPVLRAEEGVWLRRDRKPAAVRAIGKRERGAEVEHADEPLWEALRACRKRLADAQNVPPYVIFHDATLRAMLAERPLTPSAMRAVSGVGDSKLERYGEAFLAVLRDISL